MEIRTEMRKLRSILAGSNLGLIDRVPRLSQQFEKTTRRLQTVNPSPRASPETTGASARPGRAERDGRRNHHGSVSNR